MSGCVYRASFGRSSVGARSRKALVDLPWKTATGEAGRSYQGLDRPGCRVRGENASPGRSPGDPAKWWRRRDSWSMSFDMGWTMPSSLDPRRDPGCGAYYPRRNGRES